MQIAAEHPDWTDLQVTWQIIEEMAIRGWKMLEPIYQQHHGQKGRLSIQTNPTLNRSPERMLEQARHFDTLAPNVQIKFPATAAGLEAIEQATYEGMNINATVSFTVSQALAVGAAVERALARREAEGHDTSWMSPICTIMIGRTDDWVKKSCERDGITIDPAAADWAGIAVFKRAAAIFEERGYRARLLAAAYRHHLHWSELIGGDISMTIPANWQRLFNASAVEVKDRWHDPVPAAYVEELMARVPEFVKAYEPDALSVARVRHLRRHDAHAACLRLVVLGARGHHRRPAHPQPGRQGLSRTTSVETRRGPDATHDRRPGHRDLAGQPARRA